MTTNELLTSPATELQSVPMEGRRAEETRRKRNSKIVSERRKQSSGACGCCGAREPLEIHHIKPLCLGGEDELWNTIALCSLCHKYAPDDEKQFLQYQRMGGQLITQTLYSLNTLIYTDRQMNELLFEQVKNFIGTLEKAKAQNDIETIQKEMGKILSYPDFGLIQLKHCVPKAYEDKERIDYWRKENMRLLGKQNRIINNYLRWLHPELPKPPNLLVERKWNQKDSLELWFNEWDITLGEVYKHKQLGEISQDVYLHYRNGWLGCESMVDFFVLTQEDR